MHVPVCADIDASDRLNRPEPTAVASMYTTRDSPTRDKDTISLNGFSYKVMTVCAALA